MKKQHLPVIAALIALVVLSFIGQYILAPKLSAAQDSAADQPGVQSLRLTEVMTRNLSALMDSEGKFYDWFEVSNWGTEPVNLRGCTDADVGCLVPVVAIVPAMATGLGEIRDLIVLVACSLQLIDERIVHLSFQFLVG